VLVTIVLEAHSAIAIDCVRVIRVDRLPLVIRRLELDFLLCNSHGDSAGDSGVDFLVGGREDYIKCTFASIADSGVFIVLICPCERARDSLAVKGCCAVRNERGQQIAVGGVKLVQCECRGIQARSRGGHDCLIIRSSEIVLLYDRRCRFFAAVDRISQSAFTEFVVFHCIQRDCKGVGRIRLKLTAIGGLIRDFRTFVAIDAIANQASCVLRLNLQIPVDIISLGKAGDRHLGIGDFLRDDGEGCFGGRCALCEFAVSAIRGSYNGVYTDVCGILGRDSQLVAIDCKAVAGVILNRKGNKVGEILVRCGFCTQREFFAAGILSLSLVDRDGSEGGSCALNREVIFCF